jgi:hypothetical protein
MKPIIYKGYNITVLFPSGYYEVYLKDRFWKFDDLDDAKKAIDKYESN